MQKCAACRFEADNFPESTCPHYGRNLALSARVSPWLVGLAQSCGVVGFMLAFHFPRLMIAVFALTAFIVAGFSGRRRTLPAPPDPVQLTMCKRPVTGLLLNIAIVICSLAFVIVLVVSFLVFVGNWSQWNTTKGESYHATSFQVMKVYFQQPASGDRPWVTATGMVEGKQEQVDLLPYLKYTPQSQAQLEGLVPKGTVIPVYFFSGLKEGPQVKFIDSADPAETAHRTALWFLGHGLVTLAILGSLIFLFVRIRRSCEEPAPRAYGASA